MVWSSQPSIHVHACVCWTIPIQPYSRLVFWCEQDVSYSFSASTESCVFGVPLIHNVQNSAHPLPDVILRAMDYIRDNGMSVEGVFRKAGNAVRILVLEETIDRNPGRTSSPAAKECWIVSTFIQLEVLTCIRICTYVCKYVCTYVCTFVCNCMCVHHSVLSLRLPAICWKCYICTYVHVTVNQSSIHMYVP